MKFSYNWIRELVPGLDQSPKELMRLITMKTAECEGLEPAGAQLESASIARVAGIEWIKDSHNQIVKVETARYGTKTVVCGAPNCRPGMLTVYLPVTPAVIAGVESDGMLASGLELGINRDHSGIVELETEVLLGARHHHRSGQQVPHAPPRLVGPLRHGAGSGSHHAS